MHTIILMVVALITSVLAYVTCMYVMSTGLHPVWVISLHGFLSGVAITLIAVPFIECIARRKKK